MELLSKKGKTIYKQRIIRLFFKVYYTLYYCHLFVAGIFPNSTTKISNRGFVLSLHLLPVAGWVSHIPIPLLVRLLVWFPRFLKIFQSE